MSATGSQITPLALPLTAALVLQATPAEMGVLRATAVLPPIAVGLVAGVWVDRLRRRPLLIGTNVASALVLLSVPLAAVVGALRVELLYAVTLTMAILATIFGAAYAAYLPSLVPPEDLVEANGKLATGHAVADVAGPGLGGFLVQLLSAPGAIALDGLSFLGSALGVALIRAPEPSAPPRAGRRGLHLELGQGLRAVAGDPILRALLATAATAQTFYSVIMTVYILYLSRDLGLSPVVMGLIFGLGGGAGVLAGSVAAPYVAGRFGLGPTLVGTHLLFGLAGLLLGLSVFLPLAAPALVFGAELLQLFVNAIYGVNRGSLEQAVTPAPLRGRVRSSHAVVNAGAAALGTLIGSAIGERAGLGPAILFGVGGGLLSFLWLCWSPIPRLRHVPRPAPDLTPR